jgi:hypothetical protein
LLAYPRSFFFAELDLLLKCSGGSQAHAKNMREHPSAKTQHDNQDNRKTTIHSSPCCSLNLSDRHASQGSGQKFVRLQRMADYHQHFCINHVCSQTRI